jgi:hypothetical protein
MEGIYKIINEVSGIYYVGSSKNIAGRWKRHQKELRGGKHPNEHLQNAWNLYGAERFSLVIVEKTSTKNRGELLEIEQKYLDIAKLDTSKVYNMRFIAGGGQDTVNDKFTPKLPRGKNHKDYCPEIYNFTNIVTGEKFKGSRCEFYTKYNLQKYKGHIKDVTRGKRYTVKGWMASDRPPPSSWRKESLYPSGVYSFIHRNGEIFVGTCLDFSMRIKIRLYKIKRILENFAIADGWKLTASPIDSKERQRQKKSKRAKHIKRSKVEEPEWPTADDWKAAEERRNRRLAGLSAAI